MTEDNQNKLEKKDITSWNNVTLKTLESSNIVPKKFRGKISLEPDKDFVLDSQIGNNLENICPTNAISYENDSESISLDVGKCIFCGNCQHEAPELIKISNSIDTAKKRKSLLIETFSESIPFGKTLEEIGSELKEKINTTFGRSLAIREIDAGSCNGCEVEISALSNPIYDIEQFGIHFVASPRHADLLLVTGPASKNMEKALKIAYDSTPEPKMVIAVGACACSGGIFGNNYATTGGIESIVPVNVFIPGCPPRPQALIYGIMMAINKL